MVGCFACGVSQFDHPSQGTCQVLITCEYLVPGIVEQNRSGQRQSPDRQLLDPPQSPLNPRTRSRFRVHSLTGHTRCARGQFRTGGGRAIETALCWQGTEKPPQTRGARGSEIRRGHKGREGEGISRSLTNANPLPQPCLAFVGQRCRCEFVGCIRSSCAQSPPRDATPGAGWPRVSAAAKMARAQT